MGMIIDFEEKVREKKFAVVLGTISGLYGQADSIASEYFELMDKNQTQAIEQLPVFMERVRDVNPVRAYESFAGGPNHDWTGPLLNILGVVYPELEKDVRERGLRKCLNFLDGLRYDYAQNQVEVINEPWLAADIVITRPLYWCGYKEYCDLATQHKSWKDFSVNMKGARSPFWLAMAVSNPEYTSLEVRHHFYQQFPQLMDRTRDAIAAMAAVYGGRKAEKKSLDVNECIEYYFEKFDPLLHDDIRAKIKEEKWICLKD